MSLEPAFPPGTKQCHQQERTGYGGFETAKRMVVCVCVYVWWGGVCVCVCVWECGSVGG